MMMMVINIIIIIIIIVCVCMYVCVCIYIYIYVYTQSLLSVRCIGAVGAEAVVERKTRTTQKVPAIICSKIQYTNPLRSFARRTNALWASALCVASREGPGTGPGRPGTDMEEPFLMLGLRS